MTSLNGMLGIGERALTTHMMSISVAGNNIANAATPGYCRQTLGLRPVLGGESTQGIVFGQGVNAGALSRAFDGFTYSNILKEQSWSGYYGTQSVELQGLNAIVNEGSTGGLNEAIGSFFSCFAALGSSPDSSAEREVTLDKGAALVSRFNMLSDEFKRSRLSLDGRVGEAVDNINNLVKEIAGLNLKITSAESGDNIAGNLRDQRDVLLQELADEVDITLHEDENGMVSVSIADRELIQGGVFHELVARADSENEELLAVGIKSGNVTHDITRRISGGSLGGALTMRDSTVVEYQDDLDALTFSLITTFNAQHRAGYGLDGTGGRDFFAPVTGISGAAGSLALSSDVEGNVEAIAASATADGVPGDGDNAILLYQLSEQKLLEGGRTFSGGAIALAGRIGSDTQFVESEIELHEQFMLGLQEIQQSVSGVSIDEESANLLMYQTAYEAAARYMGVIQELMDTLLRL